MNASAIPLDSLCQSLAEIAPLQLAESWDNVGLLVGDRQASVQRVMTCLTLSPAVVSEAIERSVDLVVTHHPLPFKPLSKITSDSLTGSLLLELIAARVAVYSAHTAFDSAAEGINHSWARRLGLRAITPLIEPQAESGAAEVEGSGRCGELPAAMTLDALIREAARLVAAEAPRLVGDREQTVHRVAIACGSGGSFLAAARRRGCDALLTGEATFHCCLEAESSRIGLGLLGHFGSERFAMESMASDLATRFPTLEVWASRSERDPIEAVTVDS